VTSFVDSTSLEVLSVFVWPDLKEERPTQRHFEEKKLLAVIVKKFVNSVTITAWSLTFISLESCETYGTY
jgi:hypothetical protein